MIRVTRGRSDDSEQLNRWMTGSGDSPNAMSLESLARGRNVRGITNSESARRLRRKSVNQSRLPGCSAD
ncbi:MAG: hypothetical protein CMO26_23480 [Thiotrichales bacterium]|nr:hypothetical protein [Thiotrichales bacterium]